MTELDSKQLGRLRRVADPRLVWTSEAGDFTPWLAENIDVLADELGMTLTVLATEVAVGSFRLDIHAMDDAGRTVVIENQLERTDHSHLGQCLVYAAGLDAAAVIWVAPRFRDEFRQALDWLNAHTDTGIHFFGVEVGVVQIGDEGPRAPVFDVIARPNDWQKSLTMSGPGPTAGSAAAVENPVTSARQDFFLAVLTHLSTLRPQIRVPARNRANWLSFASGPFGYWCISVTSDGRLRLEAYLDTAVREVNKQLLDEFAVAGDTWQGTIGEQLSFERLDDRKASRIAVYQDIDLSDAAQFSVSVEDAADVLRRMYDALNLPLRAKAKELKALASDMIEPTTATAVQIPQPGELHG